MRLSCDQGGRPAREASCDKGGRPAHEAFL